MIKFRAWDKNTERMWDIETWHIADEYVDLIFGYSSKKILAYQISIKM